MTTLNGPSYTGPQLGDLVNTKAEIENRQVAVPVGYQLWFDSERPEWGGPIFFAALAVLYLLFTPPVRALLNREEPGRRQ